MKLSRGLCSILVIASFTHMQSALGVNIYVDQDTTGDETGSQANPFKDLWRADQHAESGNTIHLSADTYPENITFAKPMTIKSYGGTSTIGSQNWNPTTVGAYLYGVVYESDSDWIPTPGFESFIIGAAGIETDKLRHPYLAPLWMPPKDQVKYVFLFSSGQQQYAKRGDLDPYIGSLQDHRRQITTGAKREWAMEFPADSQREYRQISINSIASKLIRETPNHDYGPHNTLLILAFKGGLQGPEPGFDEFDSADREKIINGYYAYLNNKVNFHNVEVVYLCGISRGGALVSRLGKRIRKTFSEPEIYISTIDGHVTHSTYEMLSTYNEVENPLNEDRHAWYTRINDYYMLEGDDENESEPFVFDSSHTNRLHVFNTVTSVEDHTVNDIFRTYCSGNGSAMAVNNFTNLWGYYSQTWVNYWHEDICENWHWDVGPKHVEWFLDNAFP